MTGDTGLETDLQSFARKWEQITEVPDPPRTLMNVIEYSLGQQRKAEVYVTRLLRYFLDPGAAHGMGTEFLEAFLDGLPDECEFQEDTYDLSGVEIRDQVGVTDSAGTADDGDDRTGYADLVLEVPGEWFVLAELKFSAGENNLGGEGRSQTEFYYDATSIGGRPTTDYESGHYYLYIHPDDEREAEEPEFTNVTWRSLAETVETFSTMHAPRLPQRTDHQLREFVDDIKDIAGMSDQQENRRQKVELYVDHYDAITDVSEAFDDRWTEFTENWWSRLRERIDDDDFLSGWYSPEGVDDWAYIFKDGWWYRQDEFKPVKDYGEYDTIRVGFLHRLDGNRTLAVKDRTLKFQFRNCPPNRQYETDGTNFRDAFYETFESRKDAIREQLPEAASLTGNMHNQIEATYDIPVETAEDFFDAYLTALQQALSEHVIENRDLVDELDRIHREAIEQFE